jgi:chromosome segregation ATPase
MGADADALRQRFEDQELALADVRRNYATLASVNKEDKMQLKQMNERHLRDVAELGEARLLLEKLELRAAALEVAAKDCEQLTAEKASLLQQLDDAGLQITRAKNTERDLYTKVSGIRERADTLEAYKQTASVEVADMRKELRNARQALAEQTARADAAEARNATAEKDLSNLRTHSEKLTNELQAVRAKVPELEAKVKESRDEVVSLEKHRRNAEVALAAALTARSKAEEEKEAAEKRVATSMFEIQALAGQLVEEQSAKTGLSDQLSSASETMAALAFSEDKLEKAEKQLRAEVNKAKLAEEKAAQKEA